MQNLHQYENNHAQAQVKLQWKSTNTIISLNHESGNKYDIDVTTRTRL
jgi:hypothetical protein